MKLQQQLLQQQQQQMNQFRNANVQLNDNNRGVSNLENLLANLSMSNNSHLMRNEVISAFIYIFFCNKL
jgi:hypothetical protein